MNLIDLTDIIQSESAAEEYLQQVGILQSFEKCIHCESSQLNKVRRGNIKCYACKREWSSKKFSSIEDIRISPQKFLLTVKCFALKLNMETCATECDLNVITVKKIYNLIRASIDPLLAKDISQTAMIPLQLYIHNSTKKIRIVPYLNDDLTNNEELAARLLMERCRRSDNSYTFKIDLLKFESAIQKSTIGKVSRLVRDLNKQLETFNKRSAQELLLIIAEVVFRFNCSDGDIFDDLLNFIGRNIGG